MRYWKRILPVMLILAMLAGIALPAAAQEVYATLALDTPVTVTLEDGENRLFQFEPETDGDYLFVSSDYVGDPRACVYNSDMELVTWDDDGGESRNFSAQWQASAGETYYLEATGYGSYTVTVLEAVEAESMELNCHSYAEYAEYSDWLSLKVTFYPINATVQRVTFTSSDETVATVDREGYVTLHSAGTALITATSEQGLTDTCTVTVKEPTAVRCGQTVTVQEQEEHCVLSFTPDADGWYGFYAESEMDTWGWIFDEFNNDLGYDDSAADGENFLVTTYLEAGKTYHLFGAWSDGEQGRSVTMQVTRLQAATGLVLSSESYSGYAGNEKRLTCSFVPMPCIPEEVTWTSSDPAVATVDGDGIVRLLSSGEAVITAATESGLTASCTVTVTSVPQITCGEMITVYGDRVEDVMYAFVPETDGWYGFFSTGDQGDPMGIILNRKQNVIAFSDDNGIDRNFIAKAELKAGEIYYLKPLWEECSRDDSYYATIVPLVKADGLQMKQEEFICYTGVSFSMQAVLTPVYSVPELLTWTSSDPAVAAVDGDGEVSCLTEGTAVITAVSESGLTASCTVSVRQASVLPLGEPVELDGMDGVILHQFVPQQSGWYGFCSTGNELDTCANIWTQDGACHEYDDDGGEGSNFRINMYMEAGTTYLLESGPLGIEPREGIYYIHLDKLVPATSLQLAVDEIVSFVGWSDSLWAKCQPDNAIPEEVTWTSSDSQIVSVDADGSLNMISAGTATVTASTASGLSASCQVTVKEIPQIACGDSLDLNVMDGPYIFCFVPETTGQYWIYSTGENVDNYVELLDADFSWQKGDDDSGDGSNFSLITELTAGQTYHFSVGLYGKNENIDYTVHLVQPAVATGITLSETEHTGEPGSGFELTASLVPDNAVPEMLTWTSSNEDVAEVSGDGTVYLNAEGIALITVTTESGLTASCTVNCRYPSGQTIVCDSPVTLTEAAGSFWYSFVPETSGFYRFSSQGESVDPYCQIIDAQGNVIADADDNGSNMHFVAECNLTAGETYRIRVKFFNVSGEDVCTLLMTKAVLPTGVKLIDTTVEGYVMDYHQLEAMILPENALSVITWSSSNENVVAVDEYGELELCGAGTAVVTVTTANGLKATCTVTVKEPPVIELGTPVTCDASQGPSKFHFVAPDDGWYGFYTTGGVDTFGMLCTRDLETEFYDDDSALDYNYLILCQLEAGKTYYLTTRFYSGDAIGNYQVCVDSVNQPQKIELQYDQISVYPDLWIDPIVTFLPLPSFMEEVTWTSSNTDVVIVEDGNCYSVAPGTAVLTCTSESGLTDTITITVLETPQDADCFGICGPNLLWQIRGGVLTVTGSGMMYAEYGFDGEVTRAELPEEMTTVSAYAFAGQPLSNITIPARVTFIGRYAFAESELAEIHFLGHAPAIGETAFEEVTAVAYYPANDPTWTEEVRRNYGGNITWICAGDPEPAGVTLSGSVVTGKEGDTTVELIGNDTRQICTVAGKTGTYSMDNVPAGTYTLRISKLNHVTREYTVTVGASNVTQDVKIHLIGDVDGSGKVNLGDVSRVIAILRGAAQDADPYELLCANVSGPSLNMGDVAALYAHVRGSKRLY